MSDFLPLKLNSRDNNIEINNELRHLAGARQVEGPWPASR